MMVLLFICYMPSNGQGVSLSKKKISLENVFYEIQKQTGYNFFYPDDWVPDKKNISIDVRNETIDKVLEFCLKSLPFHYKITGTSIVLYRRPGPGDTFGIKESSELIDVSGEIRNERGELLDGITVATVGTSKATATDDAGRFDLKDIAPDATLIITGTNIEPYRVKVDGKTELLLTVTNKVNIIDEVIVSTGYQDIPKERATGSFVKISNELYNRKTGPDVLDRLDGISNGVLFDKRKSEPNIQIRGLFTLTESISQPLIVVDNFPYEGNINNLNTNDIESVTILKDASATSIWGARAGNGVIVITTKKGAFNQPMRVSFNTNLTVVRKVDLHQIPDLTASDYIDFEKELFDMGVFDGAIDDRIEPITPATEIFAKQRSGQLTPAEAERQLNQLRARDVRNDFEKYLYRNEVIAQHSLNVSGGGKKHKYFFSAGFNKNKEELVGNDNSRFTLRADNTFIPLKNLQVRIGTGYTRTSTSLNSPGAYDGIAIKIGNKKLPLYSSLIDDSGNYAEIDRSYKKTFTDTVGTGKLLDWKYRPLQELEVSDEKYKTDALVIDLNLKYNLTKALSVELKYQYQRTNDDYRSNHSIQSYFARDLINDYTQIKGDNVSYIVPYGGIVDRNNSVLKHQTVRPQVNFSKIWEGKHDLHVIGGAEVREVHTLLTSSQSYAADVDYTISYPIISSGGFATIPGSPSTAGEFTNRFVSLYTNASYKLYDKYTFSASARKDASNLFGANSNQRVIPLWSVGAGWKISKENFYKYALIPDLSFRVTYGFSGNVNNTISAITTITKKPGIVYTNLPYAGIDNVPNEDLRWEKVGQLNFGLDFKSRNNRITGNLEYFRKYASDILGEKLLDPTVGVGTLTTNSANVKGSGLDIQLSTLNINTRAFKWSSNFVFNQVSYKVSRILFDVNGIGYISAGNEISPILGYNPYLIVSYKWAGLDPATGDPQGYINNTVSKEYSTITGLTPFKDQYISGPALPRYFGNLTNIFTWKRFSISANILYKMGYFFRKSTFNYNASVISLRIHPDYLKRWKKPGDEKITNVPSAVLNSNRSAFYTNSEITVFSGDHIRFNDIRLDYTINKFSNVKLPIKNIQLYIYINDLNVLLWKKNKIGLDPDFPSGLRSSTSFTTGVKIDW